MTVVFEETAATCTTAGAALVVLLHEQTDVDR
jgi:hypothetical protein